MMTPRRLWNKAKRWLYRHLVIAGKGIKAVDTANKRLAVCSRCEFRDGPQCKIGGVDLKTLSLGVKSDCPKGFWDE